MRAIVLDRLTLRDFADRDVPAAHAAIYGDPLVMRYVGAGPMRDEDQTAKLIQSYIDRGRDGSWTFWAVTERSSGALIGDAGLWATDAGELELGYTFARSAWGRGYATEAAGAILQLAFEAKRVAEVIALVHPANAPSIRVVGRLGFSPAGTRLAHGYEHLLFRLARPR